MTAEFDRASELLLQLDQKQLADMAVFLSGYEPDTFVRVAETYLGSRARGAELLDAAAAARGDDGQ